MSITFGRNDMGYATSIRQFNGMIEKQPEIVFVCKDEEDIRDAINYARIRSKSISVLGSGHNVSGRSILGDVVVSVRNMQGIKVFPEDLIAICEPGVTMSILDKNTFNHKLVCTGGTVSSTGITGLTLGGGIGWLLGNLGTTSDNVKGFEIIDYLGKKIVCNDTENQELFWVMKGAGLCIGVVTKIIYNLHLVHAFSAYNCLIDFNLFDEVKDFYTEVTENCSKRLTFFLSLLTVGNNEKIISLEIAFSNFEDSNSDEYLILVNKIKNQFIGIIKKEKIFDNYIEFQSYFDNEKKYGMRSYWKSLEKEKIEKSDWDIIGNYFKRIPSTNSALLIDRYHGKMCEIPIDSSAFNKRKHGYGILITSQWTGKKNDDKNIQWTKNLYNNLIKANDIKYINYLGDPYPDEKELVRAFGIEKLKTIRKVIQQYDPNNIFIKPIN